jgi:iron complex transport system ATP-binding protein
VSFLMGSLVHTLRGVSGISGEFRGGGVTAIIGPNGAGKSTVLQMLGGLVAPDSGTVTLDGVEIKNMAPNRKARRIGYLPQSGAGIWNVTARELVALGRIPHRSRFAGPSLADEIAVQNALEATDTARLADRPLDQMSGGERARVLLARVFAGEPEWLLADEPLANLDPRHQQRMMRLMRETAAGGCGVITVLHDLNAAATADDVIMLSEGRVIAAGPTEIAFTAEALGETYDMSFSLHRGKNGQTLVGTE